MTETKLVTPFWFAQRQLKAEAVGDDFYKITGPNIPESFVGIRVVDNGLYQGYFRHSQDGDDDAVTGMHFETPVYAWAATFELYREEMIL